MIRALLATAAFGVCALAGTAQAQQVADCDWQASSAALVEPWEAHTQTFSNGDVRIALLDTIDPAAGAFHILVLSPPYEELGNRQCATLGMEPGFGFAGVDFSTLTADYDPSVGLIFEIWVQVFDGDTNQPAMLRFTLNQATGDIAPRLFQ